MSSNNIDFIALPYEKCKNDLAAFRNKNRSDGRDSRYFEWRYLLRPSGKEPVIVWAIDKGGAPAGSLSLIPHEYFVNGQSRFLGVLGDISVSESMRGKGIAGRMLECLHGLKQVSDLGGCMVLPNEEASRPLLKAGWVKKSCLERHVKPLDISGRIRKKAGGFIAGISAPPLNLILRMKEAAIRVPAGYKTACATGFDERFDEIWRRLPKEGVIAGKRDMAYLSWRFADHPIEKFSVFLLSEGAKPSGYIVYKTDEDTIKVYDLLCPASGVEADYLVSSFLKFARSLAAASVTVRASNIALKGFDLKKFGFIKRPDAQDLMARCGSEGPAWNSWHITAGDKDV